MTPHEILTARLGDENLARIDRLAEERGISRDAMLAGLVVSGLAVCEMAAREAPRAPQPTDPMDEGRPSPAPPSTPSPWLGWAILVLVGLVVVLCGWGLVRVLDGRARPAVWPPPAPSASTRDPWGDE